MHRRYRIAIADIDQDVRAILRTYLSGAGHEVVFEASSCTELVDRCTTSTVGSVQLVIADIKVEGLKGIEAIEGFAKNQEIPFIIVSESEDDNSIEQAVTHRAFAYLLKPIRVGELQAAIQCAVQRFEELHACHLETASVRQSLEDRKVIERAKGVLMRERALDEPSAFVYLQQLARQHRQKLVDVAKSINLAEQALNNT